MANDQDVARSAMWNAAGLAAGLLVLLSASDALAQRGGQHLNSPGYQRALIESRKPSRNSCRRQRRSRKNVCAARVRNDRASRHSSNPGRNVRGRTQRPSPELVDGRKLQAAGVGMRPQGAFRTPEDHRCAGRRAAARDVRAQPLGFFGSPGPVTKPHGHTVLISHAVATKPRLVLLEAQQRP